MKYRPLKDGSTAKWVVRRQIKQLKILMLVVVPLVRFAPSFVSKYPTFYGDGTSDVSGALLYIFQLKTMDTPISLQSWTGAPSGYSNLSPTRILLITNHLFLWCLARVLEPHRVLATYSAIGLLVSGALVYWFCRILGSSPTSALLAGFILQSLPWIEEKSSEHITYLFAGLVVLPIGLLLKLKNFPGESPLSRPHRIALITASMFFVLSIDPYLGMMSALAALIFMLAVTEQILFRTLLFSVLFVGISTSVLIDVAGVEAFGRFVGIFNYGRGLTGKSDFIFAGNVSDYFRPRQEHPIFLAPKLSIEDRAFQADQVNYFGLINIVFLTAGISAIRKLNEVRIYVALLITALIFVLLSVRIRILGISVNLAEYFWLLQPGVRVISRYGLVAQVLVLPIVAIGIDFLRRRIIRGGATSAVLSVILVVLLVADLGPFVRANESLEAGSMGEIQTALAADDVAAILPVFGSSTEWIGIASLVGTPVANSERDSGQLAELTTFLRDRDSRGAWCLARSLGISHLLILGRVTLGKLPSWKWRGQLVPDKSYFELRGIGETPILYPDHRRELRIYQLKRLQGTIPEAECR